MILVGEETGSIAKMLGELAQFYETEVERKRKIFQLSLNHSSWS
jgi:type II secretory pathway component PulF